MKGLIDFLETEKPDFITELIADCSEFHKGICHYAREVIFREDAAVNVYEINGSNDREFVGKTWLELLTLKSERMRAVMLHHISNPKFFFSSDNKMLHYKRVGEYLYVADSCNHRTALVKALFFKEERNSLSQVKLTEYNIDEHLAETHKLMKATLQEKGLNIPSRIIIRKTKEKQGIGWKVERLTPLIQISNPKKRESLLLKSPDVIDFISEVKSASALRILRTNRYAKFLK